jgi:hypothetical protein
MTPPLDTDSFDASTSDLAPHGTDAGALLRLAEHEATVRRVGICEHQLLLSGTRLVVEADTGRVIDRLDTDPTGDTDDPGTPERVVRLRCRNRRAVVCPACSALYKLDAYHLVVAGLRGGKNVPDTVAGHPRVFVTLTAPSFGTVHRGPDWTGTPRICHPDKGCGRWHPAGDPAIGTALDPARYDYTGQVLFNAHAGALWATFTTGVRRTLATAAGLSRKDAAAVLRVVFAKVAEFQGRGVVHFHAIVRLDGADGSSAPPPAWASLPLLRRSIRTAARHATTTTTRSHRVGVRVVRFGRQVDIRPITTTDADTALSDVVVARYVAKYATKSAESAGLNLASICCGTCHGAGTGISGLCRTCAGTGRRRGVLLDELPDHARALVDTCWRLGGYPEYGSLRLRRYAHQAGYRGHFCTKSRTYSTTFTALRAERQAWATTQLLGRYQTDHTGPLVVVTDYHYRGRGDRMDEPIPRHRLPSDG